MEVIGKNVTSVHWGDQKHIEIMRDDLNTLESLCSFSRRKHFADELQTTALLRVAGKTLM
jgi:hypothetical protein